MSKKVDESYQRRKERSSERQLEQSRQGRDIGTCPDVVNPERRAQAERDFEFFCRTYFPETFSLAWSNDHRRAIQRIQDAVLGGGLFSYAMPRGSGKTVLSEIASLWAVICGHRDFVLFVGSDEGSALESLESLKTELETNDLLLEDFPAVAYPVRCLEGIAHRCNGQTSEGNRTHIGWTAKEIVLPTIKGSPASGAILKATGITGRIRGMSFKRPSDGRKVRPSLVVIDDPQTDESARSPSQCANRESILAGAILGLAGPGKKIAGIMPCTVIAPGDMADRILDRDKHPEWQGERTKMLRSFPTNAKLWEEYKQVRDASLKAGNGGKEATEFYRANRESMDAGAEASWPVRFNPDELSAIQHAMNLKMQDERAFFAEYQNDPLPEASTETTASAGDIAAKINRIPRGVPPLATEHLTAFIDVQQKLLYYAVCGWTQDFGGSIVDYGSFPDQKRDYFSASDARQTLQRFKPGAGNAGAIYAGLDAIVNSLAGREWTREDGSPLRISRIMIDSGWGEFTELVYQFCRESKYAGIVMPSKGQYVGASSLPWDQYKRKQGERLGHHWLIRPNRATRLALIDTNYWKSFVHQRLSAAMGDKISMSLYGSDSNTHRMLCDHLTSEYVIQVNARGRTVNEWKAKPGKPDNHLFDCVVGCAVGASIQGVNPMPVQVAKPAKAKKRKAVSYL